MLTDKIRKYILPNIPYLFIGWAFLKLGTAYRLAAGANAREKLLGLMQTIGVAFADFSPGLDPFDWLVGIVGAVAFRLLIYFKSKNAKKFRRDEEYDKQTNKQFITVQTSGGNTFYIVIDYDKPVNEEEEQYQTYFFSIVDEADLLAAAEAAGVELPACACTVKCAAGAINTNCPVCATNMTECVGVAPEPESVEEPEPDPQSEPEQKSNTGTLLLILAVALIGGGAGWYFKVYRPKHQRAEQPEEDYKDELEDYDDAPPWDEDESTEEDA